MKYKRAVREETPSTVVLVTEEIARPLFRGLFFLVGGLAFWVGFVALASGGSKAGAIGFFASEGQVGSLGFLGLGLMLVGFAFQMKRGGFPDALVFDNEARVLRLEARRKVRKEIGEIPYGDIEGLAIQEEESDESVSHRVQLRTHEGEVWCLTKLGKKEDAEAYKKGIEEKVRFRKDKKKKASVTLSLPFEESERAGIVRVEWREPKSWQRALAICGVAVGGLALCLGFLKGEMRIAGVLVVGVVIVLSLRNLVLWSRPSWLEVTDTHLRHFPATAFEPKIQEIAIEAIDSVIFDLFLEKKGCLFVVKTEDLKETIEDKKEARFDLTSSPARLPLQFQIRLRGLEIKDGLRMKAWLQERIAERRKISFGGGR